MRALPEGGLAFFFLGLFSWSGLWEGTRVEDLKGISTLTRAVVQAVQGFGSFRNETYVSKKETDSFSHFKSMNYMQKPR